MIYFIENADEHIKIGSTNNLQQRITNLQTGNPFDLKVLYTIDIPEDENLIFENHIHSICINYLIGGEWYKKNVLEFLQKHPYYKQNMKVFTPAIMT